MTDDEICQALTELLQLMREHGSRADEVRDFIRARADERFRSLALTVILLYENLDEI